HRANNDATVTFNGDPLIDDLPTACLRPYVGGKIASVMSSAYKRHGYILERAILEAMKLCPHFEVRRDDQFHIPPAVLHVLDGSIAESTKLIGTDYPYSVEGPTLQVDCLGI